MGQGFSVVVGMSIAYMVSFFGLLLAYIVYQRNHNQDDLWRTRPIGVSFFAAVYGYILPLLLVANAGLTLLIKSFKGWDFNRFIWTDTALIWPIAGVLMFWLIGKLFWSMKSGGYAAAVAISFGVSLVLIYEAVTGMTRGESDLYRLGSVITGLIWHLSWMFYFLRLEIRGLFLTRETPA